MQVHEEIHTVRRKRDRLMQGKRNAYTHLCKRPLPALRSTGWPSVGVPNQRGTPQALKCEDERNNLHLTFRQAIFHGPPGLMRMLSDHLRYSPDDLLI